MSEPTRAASAASARQPLGPVDPMSSQRRALGLVSKPSHGLFGDQSRDHALPSSDRSGRRRPGLLGTRALRGLVGGGMSSPTSAGQWTACRFSPGVPSGFIQKINTSELAPLDVSSMRTSRLDRDLMSSGPTPCKMITLLSGAAATSKFRAVPVPRFSKTHRPATCGTSTRSTYSRCARASAASSAAAERSAASADRFASAVAPRAMAFASDDFRMATTAVQSEPPANSAAMIATTTEASTGEIVGAS